ncbi:MAG: MMPL family transporter [Holophagales bacterium]|nr:MMPL family transporter [Holophagales bacterium]MYD23309.1 MMPL family transporter [Holophagales bacterium]MYI32919.1 MMPL family transporter [Holophagales bacterium]
MSMRRALDAVARWTIRSPWSAIAWAVVPALALAALLPATTVDLTFTGVMNRGNEHVGRYFEMSEEYELGGLLLVLLEGDEERLDQAVARTIEAASALPSVAAARPPLPLEWLAEQAPWLVERPLFDRWLALVERPDDVANLAEFAAAAVALRGAVASVPGARLLELKMAKDPLAEEVGESPFSEIEAAIESALAGSGVTAGFSGLPALSAGDQEQTLGAIKRLTPLSLVLVLLLFRIVEKRPGGMLSVAAVLILAIGAALGAVGLLTGKLTVMETFFGVTVFGLGIDFAVHLFVRQREELAHGRSFEQALRRTLSGAGRGVVAGGITTAGAFLIAATAPDPVALHLGLSGGLGLLFCLPLTLLILPAVWVLRQRRHRRRVETAAESPAARATPVRVPGLPSVVRWATERPVRSLAVSAVLLAAALAGLPRLQVETRLERIMNRGVPAIAMVDRIQEVLGTNGAPWILAAEGLEEAREFAGRLDGHPLFSETISLGTILPADLPERAAALHRVLGAEDGTVGAAPGMGDPRALAVGALRRAAAAGPPDIDSLPPGLRDKFIAPNGELLVYAYAADSKADGALARRQREVVQAIDPGASGLLAVVEGMMIGDRPWIPWIALSILGFVLLVLCVDFRRPASVLLAVLPVLAAVPFTLGVLCWVGIPFNVMTWLVLPLIFGLGIDDGIHVVHRFLDDPAQPIRGAALSVGRAIAMTTLTTTASFSILLFTDHPGLETMAAVMLIGLPACLLASVTVLPAAAVLLLGRR